MKIKHFVGILFVFTMLACNTNGQNPEPLGYRITDILTEKEWKIKANSELPYSKEQREYPIRDGDSLFWNGDNYQSKLFSIDGGSQVASGFLAIVKNGFQFAPPVNGPTLMKRSMHNDQPYLPSVKRSLYTSDEMPAITSVYDLGKWLSRDGNQLFIEYAIAQTYDGNDYYSHVRATALPSSSIKLRGSGRLDIIVHSDYSVGERALGILKTREQLEVSILLFECSNLNDLATEIAFELSTLTNRNIFTFDKQVHFDNKSGEMLYGQALIYDIMVTPAVNGRHQVAISVLHSSR